MRSWDLGEKIELGSVRKGVFHKICSLILGANSIKGRVQRVAVFGKKVT